VERPRRGADHAELHRGIAAGQLEGLRGAGRAAGAHPDADEIAEVAKLLAGIGASMR